MALIKCRECGHQASTKAEACPGCGAKPKTSSGFVKLVVFGLLVLVGLLAAGVAVRPKGDVDMLTVDAATGVKVRPEPLAAATPPVQVAPIKPARTLEEDPPAKVAGSQWSYDESPDSMGKGKIRTADVFSSNEVEFDFPYHVPQRALLVLRTHPRHGKDVLFKIQRGQFLCSPFDDCQVLVRFDEEAAVRFAANTPEDNSNETLFLGSYARFFEKLTKAKRVRISANVFQQGTPVFEFDVSGFDQGRYKGEPPKASSR